MDIKNQSNAPVNSACRILADGCFASNAQVGLKPNNNDLIIGPSGSGKTRGYVMPNILQTALYGQESLVLADTKGTLAGQLRPVLLSRGFDVININLADPMENEIGYNPLDFISYDPLTDSFSENEINTIATCLSPMQDKSEPFWDLSARSFLKAFIAYVMEALIPEEHTPEAVAELYINADKKINDRNNRNYSLNGVTLDKVLFYALDTLKPDCMAARYFNLAKQVCRSDKTYSSIKGFLSNNLEPLMTYGARRLSNLKKRVDFKALAGKKTALFLTVSDSDPAMYPLANLFYSQAIQELMKCADNSPGGRLRIPVRIILDDFATNVVIPNFDRLISVIRSRAISVSVILQSISQLKSIYKSNEAKTIINNCDNVLYLGGQDEDTIEFISKKADKTFNSISGMGLDDAWLFVRGSVPVQVRQYELNKHPLYGEIPESRGEVPTPAAVYGGTVCAGMGVPRLKERFETTLTGGEPFDDYYYKPEKQFAKESSNREPGNTLVASAEQRENTSTEFQINVPKS